MTEENKAIEKIKELEKLTREESKERNLKETQKLYKEYADYYLILLNLIEKLQKENEELKEKVFKRDKELIRLEEYANKNFERKDDVKAKYVPKDKIRVILEDEIEDAEIIYHIKKLLEEE